MRVSFDLDEVLFVSPKTHKTEPPLSFPICAAPPSANGRQRASEESHGRI